MLKKQLFYSCLGPPQNSHVDPPRSLFMLHVGYPAVQLLPRTAVYSHHRYLLLMPAHVARLGLMVRSRYSTGPPTTNTYFGSSLRTLVVVCLNQKCLLYAVSPKIGSENRTKLLFSISYSCSIFFISNFGYFTSQAAIIYLVFLTCVANFAFPT